MRQEAYLAWARGWSPVADEAPGAAMQDRATDENQVAEGPREAASRRTRRLARAELSCEPRQWHFQIRSSRCHKSAWQPRPRPTTAAANPPRRPCQQNRTGRSRMWNPWTRPIPTSDCWAPGQAACPPTSSRRQLVHPVLLGGAPSVLHDQWRMDPGRFGKGYPLC